VTWIKKAPVVVEHACAQPRKTVIHTLPSFLTGGEKFSHVETVPEGSVGDLWRCDTCGDLWRVDYCWPPRGVRPSGLMWRRASWWQRLRNRKAAE